MMANSAGAALNRQINQIIIPTIDKHRIGVMAVSYTHLDSFQTFWKLQGWTFTAALAVPGS